MGVQQVSWLSPSRVSCSPGSSLPSRADTEDLPSSDPGALCCSTVDATDLIHKEIHWDRTIWFSSSLYEQCYRCVMNKSQTMTMSDQLLASPLLPSSPHPTQAISSIIHYPHSVWSGPGREGIEGENKLGEKQWWEWPLVNCTKAGGTGFRVLLPCACCLLQTTLRALPICHPKCCPPQHPPAAGARPSQGLSGGQLPMAAWDLQGWLRVWPQHNPASCSPTDLQSQNQVWVWAGFTSSSSWAEAQLLPSPFLPEPQPTQVSLCPSQLELQIARQAWQWQISLRAFTLPSAFARSSRACEMQMLSHLRVLFNQPQMLRLIEQWFA